MRFRESVPCKNGENMLSCLHHSVMCCHLVSAPHVAGSEFQAKSNFKGLSLSRSLARGTQKYNLRAKTHLEKLSSLPSGTGPPLVGNKFGREPGVTSPDPPSTKAWV